MSRALTRLDSNETVIFPRIVRSGCSAPHHANNLDSLGQCLEAFSRTTSLASHCDNWFVRTAAAQTQLEASITEVIKACRRFGKHGRRAHSQIRHRRKHAHPPGLPQNDCQERQSVKVAGIVRGILNANEIVAKFVEKPCSRERCGGYRGRRGQGISRSSLMFL